MCTRRASCCRPRKRPGAELAVSLGLRTGGAVFHTVLIHMENGVPIQYEDRYVNPAAAPEYLETDFTLTSPTLHLLQHAPLTEANYSIEACLPTAEEAKELAIKRSEPCLVMMRRTVSGANVASVAAWSIRVRATALPGSSRHELDFDSFERDRARALAQRRWRHAGTAGLAAALAIGRFVFRLRRWSATGRFRRFPVSSAGLPSCRETGSG